MLNVSKYSQETMVPIISNKGQVTTVDVIQLSIPACTPLILDSGCIFQYLEELRQNTDVWALVVIVQSSSRVWLFATPWTAAFQASLSLTISQSLPKFMFIALVMPASHLIPWHPLLLLPSIFLSIRNFSNASGKVSLPQANWNLIYRVWVWGIYIFKRLDIVLLYHFKQ